MELYLLSPYVFTALYTVKQRDKRHNGKREEDFVFSAMEREATIRDFQ
jgi:hypothetical protein